MKRLIMLGVVGALTALVWDEKRREMLMEKAAAIAKIASERMKSVS